MTGVLAGIFDPVRHPGPADLTLGASRLGAGPLAVAWNGPAGHQENGLICMLQGRLTSLGGLDPSGGPETGIATGYGRVGDRVVEQLRGDFTALVWDAESGTGLLARDRLGGRSLFTAARGTRLWFASELHTLLDLLPARPVPDEAAVLHWLLGSSLRGGRTLYAGVRSLEPGTLLRLGPEGVGHRRYWAPTFAGMLDAPRDELVERLREALTASVGRSLGRDARTGILLSGGLDSASVAALAVRARTPAEAPAAYSAVFPGHPATDESAFIDVLTTELSLPSVRIAVRGGSMVAGALDYLEAWRLPLGDQNNFFMQPLLRRAAQEGVTAILDGEGGDELFGAEKGLIADHVRRGGLGAAVRQTARLPGGGSRPPLRPLVRLLLAHGLLGALPYGPHRAWMRAQPGRQAPGWFPAASARLLVESDDSLAWKRLDGPRWWAQLADGLTAGIGARGVHDHARRRAAMAGLDARHPLLDPDLLELVLRIPPELSFDPNRGRPMLRAAVSGLVPDRVRLRARKSYFDAPFYEAMTTHDREPVRRLLLDPRAEVGGFVDLGRVRAELLDVSPERHPRGARFWTASAWRLASMELWLRSQVDPALPRRLLEGVRLRDPDYELTGSRTVPP